MNPFASQCIDQLRQGKPLHHLSKGRALLFPGEFGFCAGVRRAVSLLCDTLNRPTGQRVWLLGPMIHNPIVNGWFVTQGVRIVPQDKLDEVFHQALPEEIFVIPAFGLPQVLDTRLREFVTPPGKIIDATCAFVRKVWRAAECAADAGDVVFIHGKPGHQETNGIESRIPGTHFTVSTPLATQECLASHANQEELCARPWTLVNQTTMSADETRQVARILAQCPWHTAPFRVAGTICQATIARQEAAQNLCTSGCDLILIIGGTDSSNTTELYHLAVKHLGAEHCFFIEGVQGLHNQTIRHFVPGKGWTSTPDNAMRQAKLIGVLAGASCPDSELERLLPVLK
ncbi:MAG: hypothetical protein IJJ33_08985 [Victivallales bacterium]|nr:hypothetical protein [Victivallales bacterium]